MTVLGEKEAVALPDGDTRFGTIVVIGDEVIRLDEPADVGGEGRGPTPYQLLSGALAACTSMTLRLYARGKGWTLPDFEVAVLHSVPPGIPPRDRFDRRILFGQPVAPDRLERLIEMADRCPVHRTLSRTSDVVTSAENGDGLGAPSPEDPGEHLRQMEQACAEEEEGQQE
jgi:putative redox protein